MKTTITTFFLMIFLFFSGKATIRTLSNDPAGGSQYSTLIAAYNASSNNDTLLVEGTNINHSFNSGSNASWDKNLVVIGSGYNTQKNNPSWKATYFYSTVNVGTEFRISNLGSGSRFYGIIFNGTSANGLGVGGASNLTFEDCFFTNFVSTNGSSISNLTFLNCVFGKDNDVNFFGSSNGITVCRQDKLDNIGLHLMECFS